MFPTNGKRDRQKKWGNDSCPRKVFNLCTHQAHHWEPEKEFSTPIIAFNYFFILLAVLKCNFIQGKGP